MAAPAAGSETRERPDWIDSLGSTLRAQRDEARAEVDRLTAIVEQVRVVERDLLDRRDALPSDHGRRSGQRMGYENAAGFLRAVLDGEPAFTLARAREQRAAYLAEQNGTAS